jgi:hypothetical protein
MKMVTWDLHGSNMHLVFTKSILVRNLLWNGIKLLELFLKICLPCSCILSFLKNGDMWNVFHCRFLYMHMISWKYHMLEYNKLYGSSHRKKNVLNSEVVINIMYKIRYVQRIDWQIFFHKNLEFPKCFI